MKAITCPECGYDRVLYVEDIGCAREIGGVQEGGRLLVYAGYTTEGYDCDGANQRFQCASCCHEWECPPDSEIDFQSDADFSHARLASFAPLMFEACKAVVENWEQGNLAEAARLCAEAVELIEQPTQQKGASCDDER